MDDKDGGSNVTMRTAGRGGNGAPPEMHFLVEFSNGAPLRIASGGGSGLPRTMDECEA